MTNVAIYIRVSTEEQAQEGYSIPAQKERLTQYAFSQNWSIAGYYIDEGQSAKDTNRPELQRLLADIQNGGIDVVLVYRLDRLTRSVLDLYKLLETFTENGVGFKSATEVYDTTTAIGRLFLTLVAALAQWERENLAERVRFGMEQMALEGKFTGGPVPFGYELINDSFQIVEEEAQIVRMIYDKYLTSTGEDAITKWLNESGYRNKKGKRWNRAAVRIILTNKIYIGTKEWTNRVTGKVIEVEKTAPPIVSFEVYGQAQRLREVRNTVPMRALASDFIFSGRLRCAKCGAAMTGQTYTRKKTKKYKYYWCVGTRDGVCDSTLIPVELLEKLFLERIKVMKDISAAQEIAATVEAAPEPVLIEIERMEKEIQKLEANRDKWNRAFAADVISLEDLQRYTGEDRKRVEELREKITELQPQASGQSLSPIELAAFLEDFETNWHLQSITEKKTAVQFLVESIVVESSGKGHEKQVNITSIDFN